MTISMPGIMPPPIGRYSICNGICCFQSDMVLRRKVLPRKLGCVACHSDLRAA
jgi:hypothetical protein